MDRLYLVHNSAMATTAAPVKQPTGTAIRTMLQLKPAAETPIKIVEWGCSFDASAAATPGQVELIEVDVAATMSTAFAAADVQKYNFVSDSPANTAGASGIPLNLSTTASGFATAAVTEGTTTASRIADLQLLPPTAPYVKQFPLGREFYVGVGKFLRVRVTFGTTVNMYCYVIFAV
jgi:hypothetical protein